MDDDDAIRRAVTGLLERRGAGTITLDQVVVSAGVQPGTVYRRWRSFAELRGELLRDVAGEALMPATPGTGELRNELVATTTNLVRSLGALRPLLASAIADAPHDPELAAELRLFVAQRTGPVRQLIEQAHEHGRLRDRIMPDEAVELLVSTAWFRVLVDDPRRAEAALERYVDAVLSA